MDLIGGNGFGNSYNLPSQRTGTFGNPGNYGYQNTTSAVSSYQQPAISRNYPMIIGKYINAEQDIAPVEVPNDGQNVGVFLQRDLQKVYVKQVGGDGLIHGNTYVLEQTDQQNDPSGASMNDILNTILTRLDGIEKTLQRQKKPYNSNYKKNNNYKQQEVKTNE